MLGWSCYVEEFFVNECVVGFDLSDSEYVQLVEFMESSLAKAPPGELIDNDVMPVGWFGVLLLADIELVVLEV